MATDFAETALGQLLSFANGRSSPERADGLPYPVYGSNGVIGCASEANAEADSIVIGRVGSYCGSLYLSKQRCWVTDNAIRATAREGNDPRFLFYLLGTLSLNSWRAGSGQPLLNQDILSRIPATVPKLDEQRAIAHILGTLDDKIGINRRMNETLEAIARALFKSWFVDFDPVRAKAEGRDPRLPKPIADLFPDRLVASVLGEIPEGWEAQPFADTVEIIGGGTPKTSVAEYWNGDISWFSVVDAPTGSDVWVVDTEKKITREGVENSSTRILPVGTTIISARGTVGRIALVGLPMAMNQSCYGLRGKVGTRGSFTYFATRELVSSLQQRAHGSVFDTITRNTLAGVYVAVPPANLIKEFENRIDPILEHIRVSLLGSRTLAALRDALLPKLLSGEIRIKDAKKRMATGVVA